MTQTPDTPGQSDQQEATAAIQQLTSEVKTFNNHRFIKIQNSVSRLILMQFARGLAFGLGSVLGASLLVSILTWWLSQFEFLPIIGDWMAVLATEFERATGNGSNVNQ
ncbi:DUF5665 domain-containing protein [Thalassovita gelatinovora]|uniref:DUF5665 domain-containing protein n=1 Tax=Thalassovita gelatinovora TaxID=53501 RepID=UPI000B0F1EEA|nr:DUF5665 domain-containing protein [Thalassovita gelatinovora]